MAYVNPAHRDLKPVANFDAREYSVGSVNDVTSGVTVQPQGPKLDYFTVTASGALTGDNIAAIINTVQQLGVVYLYEYTDTTNDTLAVAVYPTAAWTASTLQTAVAVSGIAGSSATVAAGATFHG